MKNIEKTKEEIEKRSEKEKLTKKDLENIEKIRNWFINELQKNGYTVEKDGRITKNGENVKVLTYKKNEEVWLFPIEILKGGKSFFEKGYAFLSEDDFNKIKEKLKDYYGNLNLEKIDYIIETLYINAKNRGFDINQIKAAIKQTFITTGTEALRREETGKTAITIAPGVKIKDIEIEKSKITLEPTMNIGMAAKEGEKTTLHTPEGKELEGESTTTGIKLGVSASTRNVYPYGELEYGRFGIGAGTSGAYASFDIDPSLLSLRWFFGKDVVLTTPFASYQVAHNKFVFPTIQTAAFFCLAHYLQNVRDYQKEIRSKGTIYVETGNKGEIIVYVGEVASGHIAKAALAPLNFIQKSFDSIAKFWKENKILVENILKKEIKIENEVDLTKHMHDVYQLIIWGDFERARGLLERILKGIEKNEKLGKKDGVVYKILEGFYETLEFAGLHSLKETWTFGFPPKFVYTMIDGAKELIYQAGKLLKISKERPTPIEKKQWISFNLFPKNFEKLREEKINEIKEKIARYHDELIELSNKKTLSEDEIRKLCGLATYLSYKISIEGAKTPTFYVVDKNGNIVDDKKIKDVVERAYGKLNNNIKKSQMIKDKTKDLLNQFTQKEKKKELNIAADVLMADGIISMNLKREIPFSYYLVKFLFFQTNYGEATHFYNSIIINKEKVQNYLSDEDMGLGIKDSDIEKIMKKRMEEIAEDHYKREKPYYFLPVVSFLFTRIFTPNYNKFSVAGTNKSMHDFFIEYGSPTIDNYIDEFEKLKKAYEKLKEKVKNLKEIEKELKNKEKKLRTVEESANYYKELLKVRADIRNAYLSYLEDVLTVFKEFESVIIYYFPLFDNEELAKEILGENEWKKIKDLLGDNGKITKEFENVLNILGFEKKAEEETGNFSKIKKIYGLYNSLISADILSVGLQKFLTKEGVYNDYFSLPYHYSIEKGSKKELNLDENIPEIKFISFAKEVLEKNKKLKAEIKKEVISVINSLLNENGITFKDYSGRYEDYFKSLKEMTGFEDYEKALKSLSEIKIEEKKNEK